MNIKNDKKSTSATKLYRVGESIGGEYNVVDVCHGGMGAVYIVRYKDHEPIVLKTTLKVADNLSAQLLKREAETWIQIGSHPNIVRAYWVREINGTLYVAAEYISPDDNGRNTLSSYLKYGPMRDEAVLYWTAQFCYGMEHALSKGMLMHRDIKPSNLFIDKNANIKIADFGLARPMATSFDFSKMTNGDYDNKTLAGYGTPEYMSPEQILCDSNIDLRTDIYSFGITIYEMCTGRLPFMSKEIKELYIKHISETPPPTGTVFDYLISKCIAKDPNKRFQNYGELLDSIKEISLNLKITIPERPSILSSDEDDIYAKALSYSAIGNPELALHYTEEYIRICPNDSSGWLQKGRLCLESNQYSEALDATNRSIELNPINSHAWNNLGVILEKLNSRDESVKAHKHAIELDPLNTGPMLNLSIVLKSLGRYEEAVEFSNRALKIHPEKALVWHNLGLIYVDMGEIDKALDCLNKALGFNPNLEMSRTVIKLIASGELRSHPTYLVQHGKIEEAKDVLVERIRKDARDIDAWRKMALLYLSEGDDNQAIYCFSNMLKVDPVHEFALKKLAILYGNKGENELAMAFCERLEKVSGRDLDPLLIKAQIIQHMGRSDEAIKMLKDVLIQQPDLDQAWYALGEMYMELKMHKEALDAFIKCKAIIENCPESIDNLQLVNERISFLNRN